MARLALLDMSKDKLPYEDNLKKYEKDNFIEVWDEDCRYFHRKVVDHDNDCHLERKVVITELTT